KVNMFVGWIVFTLAPLLASGDKEVTYCVDVVFVLQTSCNLDDSLVNGATQFIISLVGEVSDDEDSTMTLITYDEVAKEVISPQIPSKFITSLKKGISRGDSCPNNFMAKTADALDLVDTNNYFSDGKTKRGKMVVVLSDGVSFDLKTNMIATLTKTTTAIKNLQSKGVIFATFEFYDYIQGRDDDRKGDDEYALYNPVLRMDFDADHRLSFVNVLSKCESEDKPPECRVPTLDLIYVIDRSLSIAAEDISKVKDFLVQLSRKIMSTSVETWIGALSYNSKQIPELNLQGNKVQRDIEGIVKALEAIPTTTSDGTYSHKAIQYARTQMTYLNNEHNRQDAQNLIIMITDGVTNIKPYLNKDPKKQDKYSHLTIKEAGKLTSGRTDLVLVGLPNMPALRLLESDKKKDKELGKAKIEAGKNEWKGMIENRYPGDKEKLETNLFFLNSMDDLLNRFDDILATVCKMKSL
ncbi:unnamed protein product, partial [Owenia fusiformis]